MVEHLPKMCETLGSILTALKGGEVGHRAHKPTRCRGTTIVLIRLHAVLCCSPESDTEDGERKENPRKGSSLADTCTTNLLGIEAALPMGSESSYLPCACLRHGSVSVSLFSRCLPCGLSMTVYPSTRPPSLPFT